jgi:coenzyme F420-0:L-glutamate ligase/coenzyme F420-1:gamma-L-glutamate ligase
MGTSVLTPTFRYHPSIVAQAFGTLGAMFPGRVILGIGTGESLNEVPSTGAPWPEFKERFARMREAVTLIRTLWRGERISFEGQYYRTEKATIYDRPEIEVPIYVAAAGALVARYAGRTGDGFICTSGKKWELYTETLLPKVAEGIAAATEPRKQPYDYMIELKVSFDTDAARARAGPGALPETVRRADIAAAAQAFRMSRTGAVELLAIPGIPMVKPGDDLAVLIAEGLARGGLKLRANDVLVLAQKIVSKAEGRSVDLATVKPSARAVALAAEIQKDPRLVELILSESVRVVRSRPNVLIVEHRLGFVMANAGIDQSNVAPTDGVERALLLPVDPDGSAEALRARLATEHGTPIAVIITDSFGRAWRRGTSGVAIGAAGLPALLDLRGNPDLFGRILQVSISGFADEIAAAASLVMGQGDEAQPVVLVRGLTWNKPANPAANLVRPASEDMFR